MKPNKTNRWAGVAAILVAVALVPTVQATPMDDAEEASDFVLDTTGLDEVEAPSTPTTPVVEPPSLGPQPMSHSSSFSDHFNDGVPDTSKWSYLNAAEDNGCGANSGTRALRFAGTGARSITSVALDASSATTVDFYVKASDPNTETTSCEEPDGGDDLKVEYSTNGGSTWTTMTTYLPSSSAYTSFTPQSLSVPSAAKTTSTQFRWYQTDGSSASYDHWTVDDVTVNGATIEDTTNPAITGISSSSHSSSTTWYHKNTASFSWTASDFGGSGISHYSHQIGGTPSCSANDGSSTSTSYSIGGLSTGTHSFKVRAIDNADNCGSVASYDFKVDTNVPQITGRDPDPGETVGSARYPVEVEYNDPHSGIDTSSIQFFVDSADKTSQATITSSKLTYTPSAAWSSGSHDLEIRISDNAEGTANQVTSSWSFTYSPSSGGGGGGGGAGGQQCLVENRNLPIDGACEAGVWSHGDVDRLIGQIQTNGALLACQAANYGCDGIWN